MSRMSDLDLLRREVCTFGPVDDIGPLLRGIEGAADDLSSVNPLRLAGDADRIAATADRLTKLASTVRLAHRQHGA